MDEVRRACIDGSSRLRRPPAARKAMTPRPSQGASRLAGATRRLSRRPELELLAAVSAGDGRRGGRRPRARFRGVRLVSGPVPAQARVHVPAPEQRAPVRDGDARVGADPARLRPRAPPGVEPRLVDLDVAGDDSSSSSSSSQRQTLRGLGRRSPGAAARPRPRAAAAPRAGWDRASARRRPAAAGVEAAEVAPRDHQVRRPGARTTARARRRRRGRSPSLRDQQRHAAAERAGDHPGDHAPPLRRAARCSRLSTEGPTPADARRAGGQTAGGGPPRGPPRRPTSPGARRAVARAVRRGCPSRTSAPCRRGPCRRPCS